ncbi:MAG: topoisomerase IV [Clostridia bacterium]|nr:topoisomerase IV [Clostridia bacterium]
MAKKKNDATEYPLEEAEITYQPITETIEKNYMPYVMTVIISRAIPEIDGFKPSHRKLLYTMYKMGLLTGPRTKSANVVGQTMRLHPHGDAAIYETMVRLTRGNEALLHPFVDSKGSFGKQYSKNMAYAASRYTEVKLDSFCNELFRGIDKNAVDLVPNYDNTMQEPTLLPTTFPNILISPNLGIAVGMASSICSFNLAEICDGTIALLKNPNTSVDRLLDIVRAPDFSGGGLLIYDREKMRKIYETGVGAVKLRAKYAYDKQNNSIDILEIPYSASIESIMDKITDLVKGGRLKEVADLRDAIDLNGFKLTLDLRRGVDPDKLMQKLYRLTDLEDNFDCNFNVLIDGMPRQLGVLELLKEWIRFRVTCYRRELQFDLGKKHDKLHLLLGLAAILIDIDKAIRIIRTTERDADVVPNLMAGFSLSKTQAEYIADIKLRNLNREYITNRVTEIEAIQKEIAELEALLADEIKLKGAIAEQLREIKKKYGKPRKTLLVDENDIVKVDDDELFEENYAARFIMTKEGYFKKITVQSLRGNDEQKLKEGDRILFSEDLDNKCELVFFTDKAQLYRARATDFDPVKASALGDYLPTKLNMEENEHPILMKALYSYDPSHNFVFIFENGKGVRIPADRYQVKTTRRRQTAVFSGASPIVAAVYEDSPRDLLLIDSQKRKLLIKTSLIPIKSTRTSTGVALMTLKPKQRVVDVEFNFDAKPVTAFEKCRKTKVPSAGVLPRE